MAEANLLLEALLERAGMSRAGLAKQLNILGPNLGLRYDHASVARWIRDRAIPRDPVPEMICRLIGGRLGIEVNVTDIGMMRSHASEQQPLIHAIDRATALWRGDSNGRVSGTITTGTRAAVPVWEWESTPDDDDVTRRGERRLDPADVHRLRRARVHYQEMYRRVGGMPVRARIATALTERAEPLLRAAYDNDLGRQLYRAVGGLAALAGVCAYDADQQSLSQRHLFTALRLAKACGDRQFGAYTVALLANQALYLDENRLVVQYAESALRAAGPTLTPALVIDCMHWPARRTPEWAMSRRVTGIYTAHRRPPNDLNEVMATTKSPTSNLASWRLRRQKPSAASATSAPRRPSPKNRCARPPRPTCANRSTITPDWLSSYRSVATSTAASMLLITCSPSLMAWSPAVSATASARSRKPCVHMQLNQSSRRSSNELSNTST